MDTLQLIDKIHTFYSESFSQLLTITITILGFSGILLPIIIQWIQSRVFKSEQKTLQGQINQGIQDAKNELKKSIDEMFAQETVKLQNMVKEEILSLNTVIQEQFSSARAGTFYLQATNHINKDMFSEAARDYAIAARLFFSGKDEMNAQRALSVLIDSCIPKLNIGSFDNDSELDRSLKELLEVLRANDTNGRLYDRINKISTGISKARKLNVPNTLPA